MRFIAALLFFFILTALPCLDLYIKWYRCGKHLILRKALWVIPLAAVVPLAVIQHIMDLNRVAIWYLWILLTILFTANTYMLFDLIARYVSKRNGLILRTIGCILAICVLIVFFTGMVQRHKLETRHVVVNLPHLPKAFDGKRIVHITDLHLGNLSPQIPYLHTIVDSINALQPDIIVFTGDLVHLNANDSEPGDTILRQLKAPIGKYAVMGNHDYGDYSKWPSDDAKAHNLKLTKKLYSDMGFDLLCDTAIYIRLNGDSIGLIGVENWGHPPFPRYGSMSRATKNFTPAPTNLLLTHDPDHWDGEIVPSYNYIDLTLSGHTHAAQMGINCKNGAISPSQLIFRHWDGLYRNANQYLFVSRGLGYVGIPFRLGMSPEISIISLKRGNIE